MRRIDSYRNNIITLALMTTLLCSTTAMLGAQECDHQFVTKGSWKIWADLGTGTISVTEKQLDSVAENGDRIIGVSNNGVYSGLLWRITSDQWVYLVNPDGTTGDAQYALCVNAGTTIREWTYGKRVYEGMVPVKYYDTVMWAHILTDYSYDIDDSSYTAVSEYQVVDSIGLLRIIDLYLPSISYEILAVQINGKFVGNPIASVEHEDIRSKTVVKIDGQIVDVQLSTMTNDVLTLMVCDLLGREVFRSEDIGTNPHFRLELPPGARTLGLYYRLWNSQNCKIVDSGIIAR